MKVLLQRVSRAAVRVDESTVGSIDHGLLLLVAVEEGDGEDEVRASAEKLVGLRVFSDGEGRMNRDVRDVGGAILLVSQFTLAGSLRKGRRPSFEGAAEPDRARALVERLAEEIRSRDVSVESGVFGAHMEVELVNDGPVTFLLELPLPPRRSA